MSFSLAAGGEKGKMKAQMWVQCGAGKAPDHQERDSFTLCIGATVTCQWATAAGCWTSFCSKAGKKRENGHFITWKETAEEVCLVWSAFTPSLLLKHWNMAVEDKSKVLVLKLGSSRQGPPIFTAWKAMEWGLPSWSWASSAYTGFLKGTLRNVSVLLGLHNPNCSMLKQTATGLWMESRSLGSTSAQTEPLLLLRVETWRISEFTSDTFLISTPSLG